MTPIGDAALDQNARRACEKDCEDHYDYADDEARNRDRDSAKRKLLSEVTPDTGYYLRPIAHAPLSITIEQLQKRCFCHYFLATDFDGRKFR